MLLYSVRCDLVKGVKNAIDNGVDIHYSNDITLRESCDYNSYNVTKFLLENYSFPINILEFVYNSYLIEYKCKELIGKYLNKSI